MKSIGDLLAIIKPIKAQLGGRIAWKHKRKDIEVIVMGVSLKEDDLSPGVDYYENVAPDIHWWREATSFFKSYEPISLMGSKDYLKI